MRLEPDAFSFPTIHLILLFLLCCCHVVSGVKFETPLSCPRFVSCRTGNAGLGDQLEQAIYCGYIATLMDGDAIVDGFSSSVHRGGEDYRDAAMLLGLNLRLTEAGARSYFSNPPLSSAQFLEAQNAEQIYKEVQAGRRNHSCHVVYTSSIHSCHDSPDGWCDMRPVFDNFLLTYYKLRANDARQGCLDRGLGFPQREPTREAIQISWHIRTGDRCFHCNNVTYFRRVYSQLLSVPIIARAHRVSIDSHDRVEWLEKDPLFANATFFHTNQTLLSSLCRFVTADVIVTSGSSFAPIVVAFLPPLAPLVLEERRKEVQQYAGGQFAHHFFKPHEAVLMEDGEVTNFSEEGFVTHVQSILADRLLLEEQFGGGGCAGGA